MMITSVDVKIPQPELRLMSDIVVAGVNEKDILSLAPVMQCDRIGYECESGIDPHRVIVEALEPNGIQGWTRKWSDGRTRIWVPSGKGEQARQEILNWYRENDFSCKGARVWRSVTFRDIEAIEKTHRQYVDGLVTEAGRRLFSNNPVVVSRILSDNSILDEADAQQMLHLLALDYLDRYDDTRPSEVGGSLNLMAYLTGIVKNFPAELQRAEWGRTAIDNQNMFRRTRNEYSIVHGCEPSREQHAQSMGVSMTAYLEIERDLEARRNFRYPTSLTTGSTSCDGEKESTVSAASNFNTEAEALRRSLLAEESRALIAAAKGDDRLYHRLSVDPLALVSVCKIVYEEKSYAQVSREIGVSSKAIEGSCRRIASRVRASGFEKW